MDQRIIAGVAAGLGDYFGIDPVWVRLGFVLSALLGGAGILLYVALWFIFPPAWGPEPGASPLPPRVERLARKMDRTPAWVGIVLLVVGGMLLADQVLSWHPSLFWGVVLIVVGVLLFRRPPDRPAVPTAPSAGGSTVDVATGGAPPDAPPAGPADPAPAVGLVPPSPASLPGVETEPFHPSLPPAPGVPVTGRARVRRERSRLGWITIGATLVALGVAAVLDLAGAIHVTLVQYLALPLAVLGLGILVGAFVGRARWLVVPAILLVPLVLVASLVRVPFAGANGARTYAPATSQQILPAYRMSAGQLEIDLRETNLGIQPITVRATNVAGRILVLVPPNTPLDVHARVGAGDVMLFGQNDDGFRVDVHRTFGSIETPGAPGLLTLDLETSLGQVEVSS
jgi:phage shock protein PspC (stress-responsive transcriptional regulator)